MTASVKSQPLTEQDEEPSLPPPPPVEEAKPEVVEEPVETPIKGGNVICTDDCPLIDPDKAPGVVEKEVRRYFADIPVMIDIARCESRFRHWKPDGTVLKNHQGSSATGVMQLMASYHAAPAANLGLDIKDLYGNMAYARVLYNQLGTTPWEASAHCWA